MPIKKHMHRYVLILCAAIFAIVLLSLSWPRFKASVHYLVVDAAIENYWETNEINSSQLDALIIRTREAIAMHDHYRYWEGLSQLQTLSGMDEDKPYVARRQVLEQSLVSAEEVVRRAPARPDTWLRIARTSAFLGKPQQEVTAAWLMSVLTGRVEPTLMPLRLELGFRNYESLDNKSLILLRDQLLLTWRLHRRSVVERLVSGAIEFDRVKALLADYNRDVLAEMVAYPGIVPEPGP